MNILHLVQDEKFIGFVMRQLEGFPQASNRYVVIVDDVQAPLKHMRGLPVWRVVDTSYDTSPELKEDLAWCDCLVVHYMEELQSNIVLAAPSNTIVLWSGWGRDYYPLLENLIPTLLGTDTAQLVQSFTPKEGLLQQGKKMLSQLVSRPQANPKLLAVAKRVDFFSAPIPEDYGLLKSALGANLRADYIQLNYASVEQTFKAGADCITGNNILIGNSATIENNHLEAFKLISDYNLDGREVIVPLSYGYPKYRDAVIAAGERILGKHFRPLVEFTTLEEYNAIISSCGTVIMNQKRQQALGNIGAMLYKGAKVFLDPDNITYQFFQQRGAHVATMDQFANQSLDVFEPLTPQQQQQNCAMLKAFWSDDVVADNFLKFLDTVAAKKQGHS